MLRQCRIGVERAGHARLERHEKGMAKNSRRSSVCLGASRSGLSQLGS